MWLERGPAARAPMGHQSIKSTAVTLMFKLAWHGLKKLMPLVYLGQDLSWRKAFRQLRVSKRPGENIQLFMAYAALQFNDLKRS